jgi:transcriptional regulator with XRE-family HTH domain
METRPKGAKIIKVKRYDPLSDRCRIVRHQLGETQAQMAFHFRVAMETYSRWERYGCPRTEAARIGIRHILKQLRRNRVAPRKWYRKHVSKKNETRKNARLAAAANGQHGE